ncbi:hypothetical protein GCM10010129_39920 [Streptomyces fumigatiscleroticus]|nr:hypothetical protein GCM10010129_39920 [Streptomyces fumigatiscleroticus]
MELTISLALLTGIILVVLLNNGRLRFWPALVAALFGFTLAATALAPTINSGINGITGWFNNF